MTVKLSNTPSGVTPKRTDIEFEGVKVAEINAAGIKGDGVSYDNTVSGLAATNVKAALDEVYSKYNIVGTVSESGGVPTGAIIERGSNANGEFVKFADGTLICYLITGSTPGTVTWPSVFTNNQVFPTTGYRADVPRFTAIYNVTSTGASVSAYRPDEVAANTTFFIIAIGRWY